MRQTTVIGALAGLLLAVALLAGCGDPDARDGGAASGGSGPTTVPETLPTAPPPTTKPGSPGGSEITATGTLHDGVEPGCVLLRTDQGGGVYLLVGGDRNELRAGGRVQVTGRLVPDLLSTCQEGQPLRVSSIRPAP
jgi:Protein of unknown function (DUF5818)